MNDIKTKHLFKNLLKYSRKISHKERNLHIMLSVSYKKSSKCFKLKRSIKKN